MKVFGEEINQKNLLKKIGDISQIGGLKSYEFTDGVSKGIRAVDISTASGVYLTVLLDRGMDISRLLYRSVPISFMSATKETSPIYYESRDFEWERTFFGGLLTTCGLTYMGHPCIDNGEELGLHGRISNIGAENVWVDGKWENDDYIMWVQGKIRQAKFFGEKLQMERKITAFMFTPRVVIEDSIENLGFKDCPMMILYHVNIGYPVINKKARLIEAKAKVIPRDDEAKKGFNELNKFSDPESGYKEQVFFHDIQADSQGNSNIALINEEFNNSQGLGIALKFNKNNLPYLVHWKQLDYGEYVCGISPANSLVRGRNIERQKKTLKFIKPGQKIYYKLEFNILTSKKDIENFKNKYQAYP